MPFLVLEIAAVILAEKDSLSLGQLQDVCVLQLLSLVCY